jgi:hypothetical protein
LLFSQEETEVERAGVLAKAIQQVRGEAEKEAQFPRSWLLAGAIHVLTTRS